LKNPFWFLFCLCGLCNVCPGYFPGFNSVRIIFSPFVLSFFPGPLVVERTNFLSLCTLSSPLCQPNVFFPNYLPILSYLSRFRSNKKWLEYQCPTMKECAPLFPPYFFHPPLISPFSLFIGESRLPSLFRSHKHGLRFPVPILHSPFFSIFFPSVSPMMFFPPPFYHNVP